MADATSGRVPASGLLASSARYVARREAKKATRAALGALMLPIVAVVVWVSLELRLPRPGPSLSFPHFRTNILTGGCDYGAAGGRDPWYYRAGCTLSREEKIRQVKASRDLYYHSLCTTLCQDDIATCSHVKPVTGEDVLCSDLMPVPAGSGR